MTTTRTCCPSIATDYAAGYVASLARSERRAAALEADRAATRARRQTDARLALEAEARELHDCPRCGAQAGSDCRLPDGRPFGGTHADRDDLARDARQAADGR